MSGSNLKLFHIERIIVLSIETGFRFGMGLHQVRVIEGYPNLDLVKAFEVGIIYSQRFWNHTDGMYRLDIQSPSSKRPVFFS